MEAPRITVPEQYNAAADFVDRHVAEGRGDKPALVCGDRRFTYRQVQEMANRVGNALLALGVEMEQRVLILCLDGPEWVVSFWGAMKIGAVPVPVNTMMRGADYAYFLNDSRASVLVVSHALWPEVEKIRGELKFVRHIVVAGEPAQAGRPTGDLIPFGEWTAKASPDLAPAPTSKDDAAFWLYSSGSTGFPKGAVHLHHDIVYSTDLYARPILGITERDVTFSAAKLFFAYGLGNNLTFPFRVGATAVLYPGRPLPDAMFETIHAYRPTIFYGVPTLYAAMLQVPDAEKKWDLSCLRLCVSAGEALPAELLKRWKDRFGTDILDGIGSTEVLHIFISNRRGDIKPGSSGKIVPGYEARLVDEAGQDVPEGEVGNLLIKGDSTAACYWNKHERTKQTMLGDWIVTGDKYTRDAAGYFYYCGRSDDMLKVGGIWVSPFEVESTLIGHAAVLEAAVVGAEDTDKLVKPKAYVVLKAGHSPSPALEADLKHFVKDKIAPYKYPRWIEFVPELPKTATGKIQRFKLRA
jgi:benzoate-CoA ligase